METKEMQHLKNAREELAEAVSVFAGTGLNALAKETAEANLKVDSLIKELGGDD